MKTHILRLGSVVPDGVGGIEAGSIDLIYSFLLQEYKCDFYSYIHINQIGDDLEEVIIKDGRAIYINIRYPVNNFEKKSHDEKNLFRLEVVHTALMRIAEKDKKLDVSSLQNIKNHIIQQNFEFDLVYKQFPYKGHDLKGIIIIHPRHDKFSFYFSAVKNDEILCKILLYEGVCSDYYVPAIFHNGKWKTENEFIIKDKNKELELHIFINQNSAQLVNLTQYKSPPFYEMMKAGGHNEGSYKDWLHSLPPGAAGAISFEPN
jgi:hypothetical protein